MRWWKFSFVEEWQKIFLDSEFLTLYHSAFHIELQARLRIPANTARTLVPSGFCPSAEVSSFMKIYISKDGVKTNAEKHYS